MQILTSVDRATWLAVAERCPHATFFHTPIWQELATATAPQHRDATIGAVLASGVRVVLPLLAVRRLGPWRELQSAAAGCYGGLIADGPVSADEATEIYRAAAGWRTLRLRVTANPFGDTTPPPGAQVEQDSTHVLRLGRGFDALYAGFSRSHQGHYRSGLRQGVEVRRAQGLSDYAAYFGVYRDTLRRWAGAGRTLPGTEEPWRRFAAGAALAKRFPEAIQLWLAEHRGRVVSGAWVFSWKGHVVYWHGATDEAAFDLYPSVVLHAEIIRDASARGCSMYDFNPSGGLAGVAEFKRRFGAEQRSVPRWILGDGKFALARTVRARLQGARASLA